MSQLKYYIIHCSDTPAGAHFDGDDIRRWHTSPKPEGRGWSRSGYNKIFLLDGSEEMLIPFDDDGIVEWNEVANGAKGFNGEAIHVCYIGGRDIDTRTEAQKEAMRCDIENTLAMFPDILIGGHYNFSNYKTCPNFNVEAFCQEIGIPERNTIPSFEKMV